MERQPFVGAPLFAAPCAWLRHSTACPLIAVLVPLLSVPLHAERVQTVDRRQQARLEEALQREAAAAVELADDVMSGRPAPSDFTLEWRNDFFKAQPGTFVPFTITIDGAVRATAGALMYLRVVEGSRPGAPARRRPDPPFAYETIFSIDVEGPRGQPLRVQRGFAVPPGRYTVYVVLRERPPDLMARRSGNRRASVLVQSLDVPDFWTDDLTTSTVILAERVEQVADPVPPSRLEENPYVVGTSRIYPAPAPVFRRDAELVVVFLIYNPAVGADKQFDVQVDYHLYRKIREGERYVTRTNPQRFNPSLMGAYYDPASGQPVLAGQGILLSEFENGDYRLGITVTDLLSRKTVSRDVTFSVIGS